MALSRVRGQVSQLPSKLYGLKKETRKSSMFLSKLTTDVTNLRRFSEVSKNKFTCNPMIGKKLISEPRYTKLLSASSSSQFTFDKLSDSKIIPELMMFLTWTMVSRVLTKAVNRFKESGLSRQIRISDPFGSNDHDPDHGMIRIM